VLYLILLEGRITEKEKERKKKRSRKSARGFPRRRVTNFIKSSKTQSTKL